MKQIIFKRLWIAGAILTVLLALDGVYMVVSNYRPEDVANNTLHVSDGVTMLIAAVLMLVSTIAAFISARRSTSASVVLNARAKR
jgi:hypothetical protein